jgi:hypothetical protein
VLPIAGVVAGLTLTPLGWSLFGTSCKPEYRIERLR